MRLIVASLAAAAALVIALVLTAPGPPERGRPPTRACVVMLDAEHCGR